LRSSFAYGKGNERKRVSKSRLACLFALLSIAYGKEASKARETQWKWKAKEGNNVALLGTKANPRCF